MRSFVVVLLLVPGCDRLFNLVTVAPTDSTQGSGSDASSTDASDNCLQAYVVDGDADGDGFPNATDLCPLIYDQVKEQDADGDGVGDDCDPHPTGKDCLLLFDDFRSSTAPCWQPVGTWTHACSSGDLGGWCSPGPTGDAWLASVGTFALTNATITGSILDASGPSDARAELFLNFSSAGGASGESCDLSMIVGQFAATDQAWNTGAMGSSASQLLSPMTPFQTGAVTLDRNGMYCMAAVQPSASPATSVTIPSNPAGFGHVAIRALDVQFEARSIVGYGFGPQCP